MTENLDQKVEYIKAVGLAHHDGLRFADICSTLIGLRGPFNSLRQSLSQHTITTGRISEIENALPKTQEEYQRLVSQARQIDTKYKDSKDPNILASYLDGIRAYFEIKISEL